VLCALQEWHQKLHNNTTPDDVPICEAYLAYLQADGNVSAYWRVLSDAGKICHTAHLQVQVFYHATTSMSLMCVGERMEPRVTDVRRHHPPAPGVV
jgi:hypothetical protein